MNFKDEFLFYVSIFKFKRFKMPTQVDSSLLRFKLLQRHFRKYNRENKCPPSITGPFDTEGPLQSPIVRISQIFKVAFGFNTANLYSFN